MLIQFQEQVIQLTEHIRDLILQGPDLTAFYILEARLTLLSTYLRPGSLLTHIFSPRPLLNILSARKLPSRPKVLQRGTNSNNLSPRQCLKLSILTLDSNPVEDLFVLAQQILETLEEWAVLTSKIQDLKPKISPIKDINFISDMVSEREQEELKRHIAWRAEARQTTFSGLDTEKTSDSYPANQKTKTPSSCFENCEVLSFIDCFIMWNRQLSKEITDFKLIIQKTKQDTSIDLDYEIFFYSLEQPNISSRKLGKGLNLRLAPEKKEEKRGSEGNLIERRGPVGGFTFYREKNKPKEKHAKQIRESCASCLVY